MRGGIRHLQFAINAELVKGACTGTGNSALMPAVAARLHGMLTVEHQLDAFGGWRPKAESHAIRMQLGPEDNVRIHLEPE